MVLFVSNLSLEATTKDVESLFSRFGKVKSVEVVMEPVTRRSRGCAYLQMEDDSAAFNAMIKLDNSAFMQKNIKVTDKGPRQGTGNNITRK